MIIKLIISAILGIALLVGWSSGNNITYDTVGSLDILSGAIIEFFLFTLLLEIYQNKQARQRATEFEAHLKEIEKLLRGEGK